jgi:hypothetical protein
MASIWDFLDSLPKRSDVTPEELARRRQGYADLYQGGLLASNRDQMPLSVQGAQAAQDFLPVIGDALALGEAGEALSRGELAAAGLLGAGAAIGLVPGAGDALAKPVMAAGRRAADIARRIEVDPNALGSMGGNIRLRPQADEAPSGIRAYHGSPHSFDKFSMDAIGTGEGAQVYGHGLYFAEAEDVARGYRDALAGRIEVQPVQIDGARYSPPTDQHQRVAAIIAKDGRRNAMATLRSLRDQDLLDAEQEKVWRQLLAETKGKDVQPLQGGSMYEVNINANPEDFLDWDAPLSEQSEKVRSAWGKFLGTKQAARASEGMGGALLERRGQFENPTGSDFLGAYSEAAPHNPANPFDYKPKFSNTLKRQGIPGIKYFDAASRGTDAATRNFVVFDENLINIVKKYGIAGAAAMLGVSAMDVEQAMAQGYQPQQPQGLLSQGAR